MHHLWLTPVEGGGGGGCGAGINTSLIVFDYDVCPRLILAAINFKPRLSLRVFLLGCLPISVHDEVAARAQNVSELKGKMSVFPVIQKAR